MTATVADVSHRLDLSKNVLLVGRAHMAILDHLRDEEVLGLATLYEHSVSEGTLAKPLREQDERSAQRSEPHGPTCNVPIRYR